MLTIKILESLNDEGLQAWPTNNAGVPKQKHYRRVDTHTLELQRAEGGWVSLRKSSPWNESSGKVMETNLITPVSLFSPQTALWCACTRPHTAWSVALSFALCSSHQPPLTSPESNPITLPSSTHPRCLPPPFRPPPAGQGEDSPPPPLRPTFPLNQHLKWSHARTFTCTHAVEQGHTRSRPAVSGKTLRLRTLDHAEHICLCQTSMKQVLEREPAAPSGQSAPEPGCSEPSTHPSGLH